jgi:hypothetical protein
MSRMGNRRDHLGLLIATSCNGHDTEGREARSLDGDLR